MKVQAAEDWQCPKSSVRVVSEGQNAFRVTGCGHSALYVCDEEPRPAGAAPPQATLASEEEYRVQGGSCSRASHD